MKILYFIFFIIPLFVYSCNTKKGEIENLISQKKLNAAQLLIKKYLTEDKSNIDLIKLYSKINFLVLDDSCKKLIKHYEYNKAIDLITSSKFNFKDYPPAEDSIKSFIYYWGIQGANYYKNLNNYILAYNCLIPLLKSKIDITSEQLDLVNDVTIGMLSGIWKAKSLKLKMPVTLYINAITSKTFYGTILYFTDDWPYSLRDCSFNITEIGGTFLRKDHIWGSVNYVAVPFYGKYIDGNLRISLQLQSKTPIYLKGGPDSDYKEWTFDVEDTCIFHKVY